MDNIKAAADLVLRYVIARALFRGAVFKPPPNLEHQIRGGVRYLAKGVFINEVTMGRTPAIVYDRKDPDFWAAVIGGDDSAIDMEPAKLTAVRRAVLYDDGTLPLPAGSEQAPAPSDSDTVQRADPRNLRPKRAISIRNVFAQLVPQFFKIRPRPHDRDSV